METEKRDSSPNFRTSTKKLHGFVSIGGFIRTNSHFIFEGNLAVERLTTGVSLLAGF